ncbi:MAG TPA: hypothetical protein ENH33_07580 [Actinobacteria bacterium]|nr:hypothetical protein [Actinomycetota bacterium]
MDASWLRAAGVVCGFLLVFFTGFWMARSGRPYGIGLVTLHKLVAVGILVVLGVSAYRADRASALGALIWLVVSLALVVFVAMIASGGVLSAVESSPAATSLVHKVAPYLAAPLTIAALYYVSQGTT